jgi:hypothetical protein
MKPSLADERGVFDEVLDIAVFGSYINTGYSSQV